MCNAISGSRGNPFGGPKRPLPKAAGGWHSRAMKHAYLLAILIGLDRFGAVILFNTTDMCISSLCWVMLVYSRRLPASPAEATLAAKTLEAMKPYRWQEEVLLVIGRALEWLRPGHCKESATSDILTAVRSITYLQP